MKKWKIYSIIITVVLVVVIVGWCLYAFIFREKYSGKFLGKQKPLKAAGERNKVIKNKAVTSVTLIYTFLFFFF